MGILFRWKGGVLGSNGFVLRLNSSLPLNCKCGRMQRVDKKLSSNDFESSQADAKHSRPSGVFRPQSSVGSLACRQAGPQSSVGSSQSTVGRFQSLVWKQLM